MLGMRLLERREVNEFTLKQRELELQERRLLHDEKRLALEERKQRLEEKRHRIAASSRAKERQEFIAEVQRLFDEQDKRLANLLGKGHV